MREMFNMKDAYKKIWRQVFFLAILLVAVFFIMTIVKTGFIELKPPAIPKFVEQENFVDNKYVNRPYHFSVSLPATDWTINYGEQAKTIKPGFLISSELQQTTFLTRMARIDKLFKNDTLAVIDVGVLPLSQSTTPQSLADLCFKDFKSYFKGADSVFVTKPVTSSGSGSLTGYFFMIELPEKPAIPYPVVVPMFFVRDQMCYVIVCRSKNYGYEIVRHDFEKVLTSFRLYESS